MKIRKGTIRLHAQLLEQGSRNFGETFGKFIGALTVLLEEKLALSQPLDDALINKTLATLELDPKYQHFLSSAARNHALTMLIHTWEHGEKLRLVLYGSET